MLSVKRTILLDHDEHESLVDWLEGFEKRAKHVEDVEPRQRRAMKRRYGYSAWRIRPDVWGGCYKLELGTSRV